MVPIPIKQADVFYSADWTWAVKDEFVAQLIDECLLRSWYRQGGNATAIRNAMRAVNEKFGKSFDFHYCWSRVGKLKNRYRVFKWIIHLSGVAHDDRTKVTCSDDAWDFICEKERLGKSYIEEGEPQYDHMKSLFEVGVDSDDDEARVVIDLASDNKERDFEVPTNFNEKLTKEDPYFWDDVVEEFNVSSDEDYNHSTAMSSTKSILAKLKKSGKASTLCRRLPPAHRSVRLLRILH